MDQSDTTARVRDWNLWERAVWADIVAHLEKASRKPPPPKPDDATKPREKVPT